MKKTPQQRLLNLLQRNGVTVTSIGQLPDGTMQVQFNPNLPAPLVSLGNALVAGFDGMGSVVRDEFSIRKDIEDLKPGERDALLTLLLVRVIREDPDFAMRHQCPWGRIGVKDDKRKLREEKRAEKRAGNRHRRRELKKTLEDPETAHEAEENLGRHRSSPLNGKPR